MNFLRSPQGKSKLESEMKTNKTRIWAGIFLAVLFLYSCFPDPEPISDDPLLVQNPAILEVSKLINDDPGNPMNYFSRATLLHDEGMYDEAESDMKKAMSFDSSNIDFRHMLSDIYFDAEKDADAISLLEETISLYPENIPSLQKLSEFQYLLNMNGASLETVDKIMDISPKNKDGYYLRGLNLADMGKTEEAKTAFKSAVEQEPAFYDALLEWGTILANEGNAEAEKVLNNALALSPKNPDVLFELGNYHMSKEEDEQALDYFRQTVLQDNQYADAHINSGLIFLDRDSVEGAWKFFNIAVASDPTYPTAYYYRGLCSAMLGRTKDAENDFSQALELAPGFEEAQIALDKLRENE